jgi:hypothetical protein
MFGLVPIEPVMRGILMKRKGFIGKLLAEITSI